MDKSLDLRRYAPATQRNREPILEVLRQVLTPTGTILEISSGTGEHCIYFAPELASLTVKSATKDVDDGKEIFGKFSLRI